MNLHSQQEKRYLFSQFGMSAIQVQVDLDFSPGQIFTNKDGKILISFFLVDSNFDSKYMQSKFRNHFKDIQCASHEINMKILNRC